MVLVTVTIQVPLAEVVPRTPAMVTVAPVTRPAVLAVVMTIGAAFEAAVMVPVMAATFGNATPATPTPRMPLPAAVTDPPAKTAVGAEV